MPVHSSYNGLRTVRVPAACRSYKGISAKADTKQRRRQSVSIITRAGVSASCRVERFEPQWVGGQPVGQVSGQASEPMHRRATGRASNGPARRAGRGRSCGPTVSNVSNVSTVSSVSNALNVPDVSNYVEIYRTCRRCQTCRTGGRAGGRRRTGFRSRRCVPQAAPRRRRFAGPRARVQGCVCDEMCAFEGRTGRRGMPSTL